MLRPGGGCLRTLGKNQSSRSSELLQKNILVRNDARRTIITPPNILCALSAAHGCPLYIYCEASMGAVVHDYTRSELGLWGE
jgi:hypothetical protein